MREYTSGTWGFALIWGLRASVFPRALALAVPNAILALLLSFFIQPSDTDYDIAKDAFTLLSGYTAVMSFVLGFRSNIAYRRWWEGGTLLQQTRGEWFNSFSSLIAFSSLDPAMERQVEAYQHMLVRLMSLLLCSALQQVSPDKVAYEIINLDGLDPDSISFLHTTSDQVEVVLQWIQRSTILNAASGVLTAPPPILSRAFQEISRGIVNLQNARKIADFPFPFPYAQTSIVMLLLHWLMCPVLACMMLKGPVAALMCFLLIFFLWCINYIAFDLENPFGTKDNDLPMAQFQSDWNKSLATLLVKRAQQPPAFKFNPSEHRLMSVSMSDGQSAKKSRMTMSEHIQVLGNASMSFGDFGAGIRLSDVSEESGPCSGSGGSGSGEPPGEDVFQGVPRHSIFGDAAEQPGDLSAGDAGDGREDSEGVEGMSTICPFPSHVHGPGALKQAGDFANVLSAPTRAETAKSTEAVHGAALRAPSSSEAPEEAPSEALEDEQSWGRRVRPDELGHTRLNAVAGRVGGGSTLPARSVTCGRRGS